MTVAESQPRPPHPVYFDVEYPERVSRLTTFFRLFMAIPQFVVVYLLLLAMGLITILSWFAILFTGRYPKSFYEFASGVMRWQANVMAYVALLRDEYPPFSWEPGQYPVTLDIPLAERQSRFRLFIRAFAVIPNQIVLQFVGLGWFFTTFLSWWIILFSGRYPRGLFKFSVGVLRWQQRQFAYSYLLRDEYPPYSVNANARPGNEVVSAIIGLPLFALYIGWIVFQSSFAFRGETTTYVVLDSTSIHRQQPSLHAGNLRLTMLDYGTGSNLQDNQVLSFRMRAEHDGFMPAWFASNSFRLWTCDNRWHSVDDVTGDDFRFFVGGGESEVTIDFVILKTQEPCQLDYIGLPTMKFYLVPADGSAVP